MTCITKCISLQITTHMIAHHRCMLPAYRVLPVILTLPFGAFLRFDWVLTSQFVFILEYHRLMDSLWFNSVVIFMSLSHDNMIAWPWLLHICSRCLALHTLIGFLDNVIVVHIHWIMKLSMKPMFIFVNHTFDHFRRNEWYIVGVQTTGHILFYVEENEGDWCMRNHLPHTYTTLELPKKTNVCGKVCQILA